MLRSKSIFVPAALVGLAALLSSCSIKENMNDCSKQQVYVDLRAFDYSMDAFETPSISGDPSTKAVDAASAVDQIAFKAFDSAGAEVYSANQNSGDTGFGALEFQLAPGSYTFVAVGNKLSANAPSGAKVSITSATSATLAEALPTDVFSLTKTVTIEPRKTFATAMTLPRVMSQFVLITKDKVPANVASIEMIANSNAPVNSGTASFDPSDGRLLADQRWTKIANTTSIAGKKTVVITFNMLLASAEQTTDIIVNAYDADSKLITTLTLSNVPMKRNRVTSATGTLFNASGSTPFTIEDTWLTAHEMEF